MMTDGAACIDDRAAFNSLSLKLKVPYDLCRERNGTMMKRDLEYCLRLSVASLDCFRKRCRPIAETFRVAICCADVGGNQWRPAFLIGVTAVVPVRIIVQKSHRVNCVAQVSGQHQTNSTHCNDQGKFKSQPRPRREVGWCKLFIYLKLLRRS